MKNKMYINIVAVFLLLLSSAPLMGNDGGKALRKAVTRGEAAKSGVNIDNLRWYDCLDREDCTKLSQGFRASLSKGGYSAKLAYGAVLSSLFAEYLRGEGKAVNLYVIEEASNFTNASRNESSSAIVRALTLLIVGEGEGARDLLERLPKGGINSISAGVVFALSFEKSSPEFGRSAKTVLEDDMIFPLAWSLGSLYAARGECGLAKKYLGDLVESGVERPEVISMWARSLMDCGEYPKGVYSKLVRVYKNSSESHGVLAGIVRYLAHNSDFKKVGEFISAVDVSLVEGEDGSYLLTELARAEIRNENYVRAEGLLNRAVALNPKNAVAHRLLGQLYLAGRKDLPKAVASLKNYILLSPSNQDAERIGGLVRELERDIEIRPSHL